MMATFPQEGGIGALSKVAGLRDEMLRQRSASPALCMQDFAPARAQVICVTSGKGGTGKTMVATNLSALLSRLAPETVEQFILDQLDRAGLVADPHLGAAQIDDQVAGGAHRLAGAGHVE